MDLVKIHRNGAPRFSNDSSEILFASLVLLGVLLGSVVGIAQRVVLKRSLSHAHWWILANAVGYPVMSAVSGIFPVNNLTGLIMGVIPIQNSKFKIRLGKF